MKIAIIGGGITGLTTALALEKRGFDYEVFEQTPALRPVGAGIWMQPNALKVLDWVGVGEAVRRAGQSLDRVELTDRQLQPVRSSSSLLDQEGLRTTSIHRARLQQTLLDALSSGKVHLGQAYESHRSEGGKVELRLSGGSGTFDLLLGADGIHSRVRQRLFPASRTRYSGQTCWRGIASMTLPPAYQTKGVEAWGNRIRFGFAPISESEVYWFAVALAPEGQEDDRAALREKLLERYAGFHPLVREIIAQTPVEDIIRSDISDLKRLASWHQDRVCLLGDAAHATTPNLGQGGCQGVEDAYYIANILSETADPQAVFRRFEDVRRAKVDHVVNTSWWLGQLAHSRFGQPLAKLLLRLTPERMVKQQMRELYAVDETFGA